VSRSGTTTAPGTRLLLGPDGAAEAPTPEPAVRPDRSAQLALGVFVAYLAVAWVVLIFGFGSERWFYRDDWDFLANRDGGDLAGIFEPHGDHLSTLPVLLYRAMYNVFGLNFTAFLVVLVTVHLVVASMLRLVMRRAGVGPWIATAAAGAIVLFGTGEENIQWTFQVAWVGALSLGLAQLVLSDHDGPIDRRDGLALLAGAGAVLSAGLGPLMVAAVGLATLVRRGWRPALLQTVPLGVLYLLWFGIVDPRTVNPFGNPSLDVYLEWAQRGEAGVLEGLGQVTVAGVLLGLMLVAGTVVGLWKGSWGEVRRSAAGPYALLVAAPLFFAVTAQGRWYFGAEFAESSRYLYVGAVLSLPALAWAAQAIARQWSLFTPVAVVLFLVGYPGNIDLFGTSVFSPQYFENQEQSILGLAHAPELDDVPPWVRPEPSVFNGAGLTTGWLLEARDDGRVPTLDDPDPFVRAQFPLKLGLVHTTEEVDLSPCAVEDGPVDLQLEEGDRIELRTRAHASVLRDGQPVSLPLLYDPVDGTGTLSVELPSLDVRLEPANGLTTFKWCGPE
jgi:hypothetical protein